MGLFRSTIADARPKTYSAVKASPLKFVNSGHLSAFADLTMPVVESNKDSVTDAVTAKNKEQNTTNAKRQLIENNTTRKKHTFKKAALNTPDSGYEHSAKAIEKPVSTEDQLDRPKKIQTTDTLQTWVRSNTEKLNANEITLPKKEKPRVEVKADTTEVQSEIPKAVNKPEASLSVKTKVKSSPNKSVKPVDRENTDTSTTVEVTDLPRSEPKDDNNRFIKRAHSKRIETASAESVLESFKNADIAERTPLVQDLKGKMEKEASQPPQSLNKPLDASEPSYEQAESATKDFESAPLKTQTTELEPVVAQKNDLAIAANVESAKEAAQIGTYRELESASTIEPAYPNALEVDAEPTFEFSDFLSEPQQTQSHDVRIGQIDVFIEGSSTNTSGPAVKRAARPSIAFASKYMVRGL